MSLVQATRRPWDAKSALQSLFNRDPWFALAVMFVLEPSQWEAIESQSVFASISQKVRRVVNYRERLSGASGLLPSWCDGAVQEVLLRLAERKFLRNYNARRRPPKAFMVGAAVNHTRAVLRSRGYAGTATSAGESALDLVASGIDGFQRASKRDLLRLVWEHVEQLPPQQRDAVRRKFGRAPAQELTPHERQIEAMRCSHGLRTVRDRLRKSGHLE